MDSPQEASEGVWLRNTLDSGLWPLELSEYMSVASSDHAGDGLLWQPAQSTMEQLRILEIRKSHRVDFNYGGML